MKQKLPFSTISDGQTRDDILDQAPVAIYISDIDTCELLYANEIARQLFSIMPGAEKPTCYRLVGYDAPCPFCNTGKMTSKSFLVRQFRHAVDHRIYQLRGKLIEWDGKPAHIEYIFDITEEQLQEERTKALSESLQTIFRNIPCGLCVYLSDGSGISPVFHNAAFYDIMGYSGEHIHSVEQNTNYLGVHPDDISQLQDKIQKALTDNGVISHVYRVWNDRKEEYRWIDLEGAAKSQEDGTKLIYCIYSDVQERKRLENELTTANEKMQDIINAIPGGVAIYRVSDRFETVYFSDGVPELSGYTPEEYRRMEKQDAADMVYEQDRELVISRVREVIRTHEVATFEFRKLHRAGHIVWVRVQVKWIGEEDGFPLLHCVFHNISDFREAQVEMDHLINSIPGGIASYRVEGGRFIPVYFSDGVPLLSGYTREEFALLVEEDAMNIIFETDRARVMAETKVALESGDVLDVSYRTRHKNGSLMWVHLNGRRMGPPAETMWFYAVFTGISAEEQLFQSIADETSDAIYVIDKANYDLLYMNETNAFFQSGADCVGKKCYAALHGEDQPCAFCTLKSHRPDGKSHKMEIEGTDHYFSTSFREANWNGIPAYVKYVRDVTAETLERKDKERLEQYFQTMVKNLSGGIGVVHLDRDGRMAPEFMSEGFLSMIGMSEEEAWKLYREDALAGVHPDDRKRATRQITEFIAGGEGQCTLVYRLRSGTGGYRWVRVTISSIPCDNKEYRLYASYHDITQEREEQEQLRQQYNDLLIQHYRMPGPDALIVGHCNVTRNEIVEILDYTDSGLLETFGAAGDAFYKGIAGFIADEDERRAFLDTFLNSRMLAAFKNGNTELLQDTFIRLPGEEHGRYVQFKLNLVPAPGTGDIIGILTVSDITEQTVSDRILHQLSVSGYEYIIDLDLAGDSYAVLSGKMDSDCLPAKGRFSELAAFMLANKVVPKDKEQYERVLSPDEIRRRLGESGTYTFAFSVFGENGDIRTKNLMVSAVDMRLSRVCLARTDITDSVREQQGLLSVAASTFELLMFIHVDARRGTMHTRRTVQENLPPYIVEAYDEDCIRELTRQYGTGKDREEAVRQFSLSTLLDRLEREPSGYGFMLSCKEESGLRYKRINVLWGDRNRKTVCLVRADATDIMAAERRSKEALEKALAEAEEANRAKSDFLSSMSHDIRTPMNAIIGMTTLASAHLEDRERLENCLNKISFSSQHLLSLINDILDMSKIERSKITLNLAAVNLREMTEQLGSMMAPQAEAGGLNFVLRSGEIRHLFFYGDSLRINQILINILGNAIKFTPEGGRVEFSVEEIDPVGEPGNARYRFTVSDTGVGIPEEFLPHIFEPFSRNRNSAHVQGTGLGLSITRGLIDLMKGNISVESEQGKGTAFTVELEGEAAPEETPAVQKTAQAPALSDQKQRLNGRCFLVAEDNDINSEILCELLKMYGAKSVVKVDGAQTVQEFRTALPGTYDAVLMDIQMPVMNGYEATRAIRSLERDDAKTVPIIAMTANAFSEDIKASAEAGMNAHVAKPIDMSVLLSTLDRILKKQDG